MNNNLWDKNPIVEIIVTDKGVEKFKLSENWEVTMTSKKYKGWRLTIPKGSYTNFATIPWPLRNILHPTDPIIVIPSIVHDFMVNEFREVRKKKYLKMPNGDIPKLDEDFQFAWSDSANEMKTLMKLFKGKRSGIKTFLAYNSVKFKGFIEGRD